MTAVEDETVVDLVGDERHAESGERGERLGALDRAGRVRRRTDDEAGGARADRAAYGVDVDLIAAGGIRRHEDRNAAAETREVRVARVVRRRDQHFGARLHEQTKTSSIAGDVHS